MDCIICLEAGDMIELDCGHQYHRRCILDWARVSPECPLCRARLDYCLLEILVVEEFLTNQIQQSRIRRRRRTLDDTAGFTAFFIIFTTAVLAVCVYFLLRHLIRLE